MREYYRSYDELKKMFTNFLKLTYTNGVFKVNLYGISVNRLEKQQLGDKVTSMISELDVLDKYNSEIRLNYNYKHTTMSSKRSSTTYSNANTSLYDDDDDI